MKFDDHNQLTELHRDVTRLADRLRDEAQKHRDKMRELQSEQARAQFTPQHLQQRINEERARARKVEADHQAALSEVKKKLESEAVRWSTERALQNARLVDGDGPERELLAEVRHMRLAAEFRAARPDELVGYIREAGQRSDLAQLEMLRKEAKRRELSERERLPLTLALEDALANVEIEGQRAAHAIIEGALEQFAIAHDFASELRSGQEAIGTQMRRAVAKHFGTGEGEQTA